MLEPNKYRSSSVDHMGGETTGHKDVSIGITSEKPTSQAGLIQQNSQLLGLVG